jgi:hypothetical protein
MEDGWRMKKRGILPWIPHVLQRWALILAVPFGICYCFAVFTKAGIWGLIIGISVFGLALYGGIGTKWLKNVEGASLSVKTSAGIAIVISLIEMVYMAFWIGMIVFAIVVFLLLLALFLAIVFGAGGVAAPGIGGGGGGGGSSSSRKEPLEIIEHTEKIKDECIGDNKVLLDKFGRTIGRLEDEWFFNGQIIKDKNGNEIGRISSSYHGVQKIVDDFGRERGEIRTNPKGEREIIDSQGNCRGKFGKNEWGETVIKKP